MTAEAEEPVSFDLAGRLLGGRYQVAGKVGEGGMAHVYAAHDTATDQPVAVKVLLPALLDDVTAMKRLRLEAGLGSRLAHPNLCHIMALH
jgi:serine/threonine protein kinase